MKLQDAIDAYVDWRRAHGAKFDAGARLLRRFCRHVGGSVDCGSVSDADVLGFLAGRGPLTKSRANKYGALAGFYRHAISRGHAARSPLPTPDDEPRMPEPAPPYVFSRDELLRLFGAVEVSRKRPVQLDANTLRALLLLLYGAGLRLGEAQRLTFDDVDLNDAVLTIRDSKFFKKPGRSRRAEACRCPEEPCRKAQGSSIAEGARPRPSWRTATGRRWPIATVQDAFAKVLRTAGIRHDGSDGRRAPCLHSLRHAAAVHRLEAWYRQGADVQRLLPALSTWLRPRQSRRHPGSTSR